MRSQHRVLLTLFSLLIGASSVFGDESDDGSVVRSSSHTRITIPGGDEEILCNDEPTREEPARKKRSLCQHPACGRQQCAKLCALQAALALAKKCNLQLTSVVQEYKWSSSDSCGKTECADYCSIDIQLALVKNCPEEPKKQCTRRQCARLCDIQVSLAIAKKCQVEFTLEGEYQSLASGDCGKSECAGICDIDVDVALVKPCEKKPEVVTCGRRECAKLCSIQSSLAVSKKCQTEVSIDEDYASLASGKCGKSQCAEVCDIDIEIALAKKCETPKPFCIAAKCTPVCPILASLEFAKKCQAEFALDEYQQKILKGKCGKKECTEHCEIDIDIALAKKCQTAEATCTRKHCSPVCSILSALAISDKCQSELTIDEDYTSILSGKCGKKQCAELCEIDIEIALARGCKKTTTSAPVPTPPPKKCPADWTEWQGNCYIALSGGAAGQNGWYPQCNAMGSQLAYIHSAEENKLVMDLAIAKNPGAHGVSIGLHVFRGPFGRITWAKWDGDISVVGVVDFGGNFAGGVYPWTGPGRFPAQPDGKAPPGDCTFMWLPPSGQPAGTWDDVNCVNDRFPVAVCKKAAS